MNVLRQQGGCSFFRTVCWSIHYGWWSSMQRANFPRLENWIAYTRAAECKIMGEGLLRWSDCFCRDEQHHGSRLWSGGVCQEMNLAYHLEQFCNKGDRGRGKTVVEIQAKYSRNTGIKLSVNHKATSYPTYRKYLLIIRQNKFKILIIS